MRSGSVLGGLWQKCLALVWYVVVLGSAYRLDSTKRLVAVRPVWQNVLGLPHRAWSCMSEQGKSVLSAYCKGVLYLPLFVVAVDREDISVV